MSETMPRYYPSQNGKDHVCVQITMSVMIGVEESEDDTPSDFCEMLRAGVKSTGAIILASSIVGQKRLSYIGSAREMLFKNAGIENDPLFV